MPYFPSGQQLSRPDLIVRLEGDGNYTNIYRIYQPTPRLVSKTLLHFQRQLPGYWRVSKSALINPVYLVKVVQDGKFYYACMIDDTRVLIARRRVAQTLKVLDLLREGKTASLE